MKVYVLISHYTSFEGDSDTIVKIYKDETEAGVMAITLNELAVAHYKEPTNQYLEDVIKKTDKDYRRSTQYLVNEYEVEQ